MRLVLAGVFTTLLLAEPNRRNIDASVAGGGLERIVVNDNRLPAGTLSGGVLTITLEIREGEWHPDRDTDTGIVVHAFAEEGKALRIPGPLIRVTEGTQIHAILHNTLRDSTVTVHGLSPRGSAVEPSSDTIQIRPGAVREVRFAAGAFGTYYYWASTSPGGPGARPNADEELNGVFIVDPRGTSLPRDRVFVLALWANRQVAGGVLSRGDVLRFTINGKSWPNTERLAYNVGDTVRFRIVNVSTQPHPMHLHGFYFNVDSRGNGTRDSLFDVTSPHRVVTERLAPGRTATMTWIPDRAGYWMFHCHDNIHVLRNAPLDGTPLIPERDMHAMNHALEMMGGLVMGIEVRNRGVVQASSERAPRRRMRLVAMLDTSAHSTLEEPAYGYVLQEAGHPVASTYPTLPGPTILLKRGEPVSITVVNQLSEATSVHWHGIELDSYYDGVADFAGHPGHIAPSIAPKDSFEARFTPPRSGTFIYHPHADELRQQEAGLSGAIVVVDSIESFDSVHDRVLLITSPRTRAEQQTVYLNCTNRPAALEFRAGERYRLRFVNIHTSRPSMIVRVLQDSVPVTWRAVAKDGMDLPADQATVRPAVQQFGNGETYDFEFASPSPRDLTLTVRSSAGALLVSMPINVRKRE